MWIPIGIAVVIIVTVMLLSQLKAHGITLKAPTISIDKKVVYGVLGLIGIGVGVYFGKALFADTKMNLGFWVATAFLFALVVLGIMGKGGAVAKKLVGLGGIFLLGYVTFHFVFGEKSDVVASKLRENAVKLATEERPRSSTSRTSVPRVVSEDVTVPAGGRVELQKKLLCYVDSRSPETLNHVKRAETGDRLIFTSTANTPVTFKIWFFNEGGSCTEGYRKLENERAFI